MRNEVPSRSLERRSRNWLLIGIIVGLFGLLIITISAFMRGVPLVVPSNPNYNFYLLARDVLLWLGITITIGGVAMSIRALTWKQDNQLAMLTADYLGNALDNRYIFIRNVSRLAIGYVDAVLVGPAGVLVFRITNKAGVYFNEGAYWMQQKDKGEWRTLRWSPTRECVTDINKLSEFLEARNLPDMPIYGVVVFTEAEPSTIVTTENPIVPVLQPDELMYGLERTYFATEDRLDQLTVNRIARLLLGN